MPIAWLALRRQAGCRRWCRLDLSRFVGATALGLPTVGHTPPRGKEGARTARKFFTAGVPLSHQRHQDFLGGFDPPRASRKDSLGIATRKGCTGCRGARKTAVQPPERRGMSQDLAVVSLVVVTTQRKPSRFAGVPITRAAVLLLSVTKAGFVAASLGTSVPPPSWRRGQMKRLPMV